MFTLCLIVINNVGAEGDVGAGMWVLVREEDVGAGAGGGCGCWCGRRMWVLVREGDVGAGAGAGGGCIAYLIAVPNMYQQEAL